MTETAQLQRDCESFRGIAEGLDRLELALDEGRRRFSAQERGYFTPDEDDQVRQLLLAYRNYRIACWEIILRCMPYSTMTDPEQRLKSVLLGLAVALALSARSLKLIQTCEHFPLLRRKLNEPDEKYELEAGFFDEVLHSYSSLSNYRLLLQTYWYYIRHRRQIRRIEASPDWRWLAVVIKEQRQSMLRRLLHVLLARLRYDAGAFWRTTFGSLHRARYRVRSFLGTALSETRFTTGYLPALNESVLRELRPQLQPGDVLLVRTERKLTTSVLPGFWAHAAIYFGGRPELESLALTLHPYVRKHDHDIPRDGGELGHVLEAVSPRVQISSLQACLLADHVCVLRPSVSDQERGAALAEAFGHLGKPYDFEFDFNVSTRIVCTELVYRSYHGRGAIKFPLIKRLGRYTLTGDDLMNIAVDGFASGDAAPLRVVALVLQRRDGRAHFTKLERAPSLLRRIQRGWRPAAKAPSLRAPAATGAT